MIRYAFLGFICAVVMLLALPVKCAAEHSPNNDTSDSGTVSSAEKSHHKDKDPEDEHDGDWKIFLSIGAGITIVAFVIGAIASRDAK